MTSETNDHRHASWTTSSTGNFPGKVVRKDLTKLVKEGANVPVYVLEYLLGSYCASNDEAVIEEGLRTVKKILAENYVRPDEAEKVKSTIRERGSLKVIDKVTVDAEREARRLRGAARQPRRQKNRGSQRRRQEVREAAGRRHLVHRHAANISTRRRRRGRRSSFAT